MPTDTSHTTRGAGTDERVEAELGVVFDPCDTDRVLVAPEQPGQPLLLYHQSTTDRAAATSLSPQRQASLYRTERTLLETRIEALERTVEQRESQLDSVIEQYETIIAEKQQYSDASPEFDRDRATEPLSDQSGPVRRVLSRLPTAAVADRVRSAVRSVLDR